ncbi:hypothetical protein [Dehalobacterium formicoaceticum]|uniref:hypothetical protein n=1 Tax=Dehalobacterium formicoaceticum TaxID=51515 RepID=UPI0012F7C353|nr:hypothetical protein [Dehalobacterium formicoaceticum]
MNETDGIMLLGKTNFILPGEELLISYHDGYSDLPVTDKLPHLYMLPKPIIMVKIFL